MKSRVLRRKEGEGAGGGRGRDSGFGRVCLHTGEKKGLKKEGGQGVCLVSLPLLYAVLQRELHKL